MAPDAAALSETWRAKQLEYTWLRALMGRYGDFWPLPMRRCVSPYDASVLWTQPSNAWRDYRLSPYLKFPTLQRLQPYPLAVLSNGTTHAPRRAGAQQTARAFTQVLSVDPLHVQTESAGLCTGTTPSSPERSAGLCLCQRL